MSAAPSSRRGLGGDFPQSPPVPVLVCFAVREESRGFRSPLSPATQVIFTGIGRVNAARRVSAFLNRQPTRLVLSCGFAGGLDPRHPVGQVLFDAGDTPGLRERLEETKAVGARFIHSDRVVVTAREKAALYQSTGGDAVEMESSAIQHVCRERGVRAAIVRVISDAAYDDLPMDFNQFAGADGGLSVPRLLMGIAGAPSVLPRLLRFRRNLRVAAARLGETLQLLLELPIGSEPPPGRATNPGNG